VHLRKLEEAGYVAMEKRFVGRKPQTTYALTAKGRKALLDYVSHLEHLLPPAGGAKKGDAGK
jgi:DNA-binding PadR family transcriptional regulator